MEYTDKEYCLEVWGDMACFTRPELKVERVSYDVITPSAARAIFEAIFWKPANSLADNQDRGVETYQMDFCKKK